MIRIKYRVLTINKLLTKKTMIMETLGTDNIKKALKFVGTLTNSIVKALEDDGKIKGMEYFQIAMSLPGLIPVFRNINEIVDEYYDLDEMEMNELKLYFASEFDIPNDQVEEKIEKAFNILLALGDGIIDLIGEKENVG